MSRETNNVGIGNNKEGEGDAGKADTPLNHGKCRRCPEDFLNKIASNMKRSKILEIHL